MKHICTFFLILLLPLCLPTITEAQQFWGLTELGGSSDLGTIFKTDTAGSRLTVKYTFKADIPGAGPEGDLIQASNGKIYGMTSTGEATENGILFEYDPVSYSFVKRVEFTGAANGANPKGSLTEASNGKLYGLTYRGGTADMGVLFEFDPSSATYTKKIDFKGVTNGSNPGGSLVQAKDGLLYGLTSTGGANNMGILFSFNPSTGILNSLVDFDVSQKGSAPAGSLIQTRSGKLCGLTFSGGANGMGTIFEFDPGAAIFKKLSDFSTTTGSHPKGALFQTSSGKLYGMTSGAGVLGNGTIFSYDTATTVLSVMLNFDGNGQGGSPFGSLLEIPGGQLYGMNNLGGASGLGILFSFDTLSGTLTNIRDFTGLTGASPEGSIIRASNGLLYGMTYSGGINYNGVIFELDPASGIYNSRIDFNTATGGANPTASLIQAANGKLYGMTSAGGIYGVGTLFEYDTTTSTCVKKFDFDGPVNGFSPKGSLIQASNGKLYGMTNSGGANDNGVLFEYDPVTSVFSKKVDLSSQLTGANPFGTLIEARNSKLYGLTSAGGIHNDGTLFEYDPATSVLTKKIDFDYVPTGSQPYSALMQTSSGKLYGLTLRGGADSSGVLFEYDINTSLLSKKLDFNYHTPGLGYNPNGALTEGPNGKLYGLTTVGGTSDQGAIFKFDTASSAYSVVYSFNGTSDGQAPQSSLVYASDKKFYGLASNAGLNGNGTLFSFDPAAGTFSTKDDFNSVVTGAIPYGDLLFICNQPAIVSQTTDTSACEHSACTLHLKAVGTALSYQWYSGGNALGGAKSANYSIPSISMADSGFYYCSVGNTCGSLNSNTIHLSVLASPPTPVITPNGSIVGSSSPTGNQWYLNGTLIPGATGQNYNTQQSGSYIVVVTNPNNCSTASAPYSMINTGLAAQQTAGFFQVYPNPAGQFLNLSGDQLKEADTKVLIYDLLGNTVLSLHISSTGSINKSQIDISTLSQGMYVLKIENAGGEWLVKFSKG